MWWPCECGCVYRQEWKCEQVKCVEGSWYLWHFHWQKLISFERNSIQNFKWNWAWEKVFLKAYSVQSRLKFCWCKCLLLCPLLSVQLLKVSKMKREFFVHFLFLSKHFCVLRGQNNLYSSAMPCYKCGKLLWVFSMGEASWLHGRTKTVIVLVHRGACSHRISLRIISYFVLRDPHHILSALS